MSGGLRVRGAGIFRKWVSPIRPLSRKEYQQWLKELSHEAAFIWKPLGQVSPLLILPILAIIHLPSVGVDLVLVSGIALISCVGYWAIGKDKTLAYLGRDRIAEPVLHLIELAGGWAGSFIAQQRFEHKLKPGYRVPFWLIVALYQFVALNYILNWALLGWLFN